MAGVVYLGHDNELAYILKDNGTAIPTSAVVRMTLRIGKTLLTSTNGATQAIRWDGSTYQTGEIHIVAGRTTGIAPHIYRSPLVVYTSTDSSGIVWGEVQLDVRSDPEAT